MKYGIIMTVHNNPKQIKKLCLSLTNKDAYIFVHVDKKSNFELFEKELSGIPQLILFSSRKVYWLDVSQVEATVDLLKKGLEKNLDYFFFISGQDYLIPTDNYLLKYIDINKNYMEAECLPHYAWGPEGRTERYKQYHDLINTRLIKFNHRKKWYFKLNEILLKIQKGLKIERKFIKNHKPYSGANWININAECAKYIVDNYNKYIKYFRHVFCPDEMFIQTMIMNSPLKDSVINDTLRYIDWETGPEYPRTLTADDYDKIISSNALFCRKVDIKKDKILLDKLDKRRKNKQSL